MSIVLYTAPMSSATPIVQALNELEVAYEARSLNLKAGEQRQPEFLALNPNGKVPTLVVDGHPIFEALAVLQWLGDRFGVDRGLWPAPDSTLRFEALSWTTWAYVSYRPAIIHLLISSDPDRPEHLHNPAHAAYAEQELQGLLKILNARLSGRPFLLGDSFSLVDLAAACMIAWSTYCGVSTGDHPHVERWLESYRKRPSTARSFEDMSPAQDS